MNDAQEPPGKAPAAQGDLHDIARYLRQRTQLTNRMLGWGKKILIWTVFFGLIYVLRDFFGLVFLTFIFCFIMHSLVQVLGRVVRWPWKLKVLVVFLLFLGAWVGAGFLMVPAAEKQGKQFVDDFQSTKVKAQAEWEKFKTDHPSVDQFIHDREEAIKTYVETFITKDVWQLAQKFVAGIVTAGTMLVLALLFSLLILLDLDRLKHEVGKLKHSKIHTFYEEVGNSIVKFGAVLGKVFEAQGVIALFNTALTATGLAILGVPSILFLSFIVFICSFVPVLGVWISSVPVCLLGLATAGFPMVLKLVLFITFVHMIEAYVLNPRIMGAALHINPVLVLAILFVGAHAAGFWGVILGVPTVFFFFKYVIAQEHPEVGLRARRSTQTLKAPAPVA